MITFGMGSTDDLDDQGLNHLFDHFLPLLEKYLPVDAVATHLVQAGLLSRSEYLRLSEEDEGKPSKWTSRIVRLVDNIASKGPRAFSLFYKALEGMASAEDDGDIHLGLQHCVEEMYRVMKDKGCISRLQLDYESTEHSSFGSGLPTSPLSVQGRLGQSVSKWSVSSAPERFMSRLYSRSSASVSATTNTQAPPTQSSDSGLCSPGIKDSKTSPLEQVDHRLTVMFADMKKIIVDPLVVQIHLLEQQLTESQEREEELRRREEDIRKSYNQALKEKEDVQGHLARYVCTISKLETECKELKTKLSTYKQQRMIDNILNCDREYLSHASLHSQLSISSVCSDSSMGTQEGIYYTSHDHDRCMCTVSRASCNDTHLTGRELSESCTLPRKRHSFKKYLRRASSFSGKQSPAVADRPEKRSESLPSASMSCLKQADSEEAGVKQLLPCKEDTEPYIPIMMVSTC